MIKDYLAFAIKSILNRKLRSWLTVIGIFIGIATVVALISIGQGMESAINEEFEKLGTNKIIVSPTGSFVVGIESARPLTTKDVEVIEDVKGVDVVAGMIARTAQVEFKNEVKYTTVSGMPTDEGYEVMEDIQSFTIGSGREIEEGDTYDAMVGYIFAEELFDNELSVRDKFYIEGQKFQVIGIMDKIGNPEDDKQVIIPLEIARELFNEPDNVMAIMIKVKEGEEPSEVAERIEEELRDSRDEEEGEESFAVQTFEDILKQVGVVLNIISAVLIAIAAISLLVGGIGIMNTMYTSVLERTKEIGIMKSLGAKNSDVLLIFMLESGIYGLVGGTIGILTGVLLSVAVSQIAVAALGVEYFRADVSIWLVLGALSFSFVVGCASGVLPARQASKLKPVDALRYE
ncbi:MAG: ABC transporter permease [archaeon]